MGFFIIWGITILISLAIARFTVIIDSDFLDEDTFYFICYALSMFLPFANIILSIIVLSTTWLKLNSIEDFVKRLFFIKDK